MVYYNGIILLYYQAAARALKAGAKPGFVLGGTLHPSIKWAEENAGVDSDELAKVFTYSSNLTCMMIFEFVIPCMISFFELQITIAFVRNLPFGADETYLKLLFDPFGKVRATLVYVLFII